MKKDIIRESQFVDLSDDALKELLGFLWEALKALSEQRKTDEEIAELKAKAKDLDAAKYGDKIKEYKRKLKAARLIASMRQIHWDVPEDTNDA